MSKFVTLLVEDDAFQREILADVLKDEGFEVIECTTAESAELIIASTGTELQALITDHNLAGDVRGRTRPVCPPPTPASERCHHFRDNCESYAGRYGVLAKAFSSRAAARNGSRVRKWGPRSPRSRAYPTPSVYPQLLADSGGRIADLIDGLLTSGWHPIQLFILFGWRQCRDHSPCPIRKAPAQDRVQVLGGN